VYNVLVALVPLGVVTKTLAGPELPAGVVAVRVVALATAKLAAVPPMVTEVAPPTPVPVMVMLVPPAAAPAEGETLAKVGADGVAPLYSKAPILGAVEDRA
jgi:hypothetical protein